MLLVAQDPNKARARGGSCLFLFLFSTVVAHSFLCVPLCFPLSFLHCFNQTRGFPFFAFLFASPCHLSLFALFQPGRGGSLVSPFNRGSEEWVALPERGGAWGAALKRAKELSGVGSATSVWFLDAIKWVWVKNPVPKWNPGKWKHGPTPA